MADVFKSQFDNNIEEEIYSKELRDEIDANKILENHKADGILKRLEDHAKDVFKKQLNYEQHYSTKNKIDYEKSIKQDTILGQFGVDSGTFGVFYLKDVLEYYPSFLSDLGEWCYTIIPDFVGNIDILPATGGSNLEDCRDFVILGVGNKTFYSRS